MNRSGSKSGSKSGSPKQKQKRKNSRSRSNESTHHSSPKLRDFSPKDLKFDSPPLFPHSVHDSDDMYFPPFPPLPAKLPTPPRKAKVRSGSSSSFERSPEKTNDGKVRMSYKNKNIQCKKDEIFKQPLLDSDYVVRVSIDGGKDYMCFRLIDLYIHIIMRGNDTDPIYIQTLSEGQIQRLKNKYIDYYKTNAHPDSPNPYENPDTEKEYNLWIWETMTKYEDYEEFRKYMELIKQYKILIDYAATVHETAPEVWFEYLHSRGYTFNRNIYLELTYNYADILAGRDADDDSEFEDE